MDSLSDGSRTDTDDALRAGPIVVYAPSFSEDCGGTIVLHRLVDRLRALGVDAYAYPMPGRPAPYPPDAWRRPRYSYWIFNHNRGLRRCAEANFATHPSMDVPVAGRRELRGAVAVYPEVARGNPLGARGVVRWLLHRPGFHGLADVSDYGSDELVFFFQSAFLVPELCADPDNLLRVHWLRHDVYVDRGLHDREGACRMFRKGVPEDERGAYADGSVVLDGMSHAQIAEIFNRARVFYCHDPYTTYLYYAARCGCIPVVVPPAGLTKADWKPTEEGRWGVAFGPDEEDWAVKTRPLLLERVARDQNAEIDMLRRFMRKVAEKFGA